MSYIAIQDVRIFIADMFDHWAAWVAAVTFFLEFVKLVKPESQWPDWAKKQWRHAYFWILGIAFLVIAVFLAWRDEHQKVLSEGAYLDGSLIRQVSQRNPFPIGDEIRLDMFWINRGKSPAKDGVPLCNVLLLDDADPKTQEEMIGNFKLFYDAGVKKAGSYEQPMLFPGVPRVCSAVGPALDEETSRQIFTTHKKIIFVIGATRFTDGLGKHEAHSCEHLYLINDVGGLQWDSCIDYVTQIDLH
jgi:hypothetical protein